MTKNDEDSLSYQTGYTQGQTFRRTPTLRAITDGELKESYLGIEDRINQYDSNPYHAGFIDGWFDAERE